MKKIRFFSYRYVAAAFIIASLLVSVAIGYICAMTLKREALHDMASVDAKKSSKLIFESVYSAMERGITKSDLERVVARLNKVEPDMRVKIYRSPLVSQQFGEIERDKKIRESDVAVAKAIGGEEVLIMDLTDRVRYLYPVKAKTECLSCHKNVKEGDVNGVIDISYPITNLKVNFSETLNYIAIFFIVFFAFMYAIFYFGLSRFLIYPLSSFVKNIQEAIKKRDMPTRLSIDSKIYELKNLESSFNRMMVFIERSKKKEIERFYTDSLTGLANRIKLREDIVGYKMPLIVIFNIDAFKEINDFYGVKVGDFILCEFGQAIHSHCLLEEKLYRFAGDEYAILVEVSKLKGNVKDYIDDFLALLKKEVFLYNDYEISVHVTAGAAIGGKNILENADMALKQARAVRKNFTIFDPSIQLSLQYKNNIKYTRMLKDAIEAKRIVPYFQPIFDIKENKITKFECLVRLIDESGVPLSPYSFLSVAKKSRLYQHITKTVIDSSFRTFEYTVYEFSINISVEDILDEDTRGFIYERLKNFSKPKRVIFEIIESEGIESYPEVFEFVAKVKSIGAKIAIDDFGTGYSNFAYLMKLDVDFLKIDSSIIQNINTDKNSYIITKTIVDFCKQINVKTVAEYVADGDLFEIAKNLGVDFVQGYFIGEPKEDIRYWVE